MCMPAGRPRPRPPRGITAEEPPVCLAEAAAAVASAAAAAEAAAAANAAATPRQQQGESSGLCALSVHACLNVWTRSNAQRVFQLD